MKRILFAWLCGAIVGCAISLLGSGCVVDIDALEAAAKCPDVPVTVNLCPGSEYLVTCETHEGPHTYCSVQYSNDIGQLVTAVCVPVCP